MSQTGGDVSEFTGNETQSSGHCVMCSGKPRTKAGRCNAALNRKNENRTSWAAPVEPVTVWGMKSGRLKISHFLLKLTHQSSGCTQNFTWNSVEEIWVKKQHEKLRLYRQILNFTSQSEFKHLVWWRPRAFLTCPAGFPHTWSKHCSSEH